MADNTVLNPGAGGDTIRTEDVGGGVKTQVVKMDIGGAGVDGPQVSAADPLPITASALPLPTGAATAARQDTGNTSLASLDTKLPAQGQAAMAASLPVVIASNQSAVPISASSLPLPTGAATLAEQQSQTTQLTAMAASLSVLDDWDESDRAKVNLIAGEAGIAGGTGADGANVPRVTLATNVGLPAGTNLLGKVGIDQTTPGTTDSVTVKSKTVYMRRVEGTPQTIFNSGTDIAGGAFSGAGTDFTNNDATIGCAPYADVMIEMPDWAAAPVAGTVVQLWGLLINTDGTDDDTDAPSGSASGGARLLGSFVIAAADALQRRTITISLAGIQSGFTPYIFNGTAQNMNNDGGTNMVVKITPWTWAQVG